MYCYTVHSKVIQYTVHVIHYSVQFYRFVSTQNMLHRTCYTVHSACYRVHNTSIQCTVHVYTVHSTYVIQFTVHVIKYTVHVIQYTVHVIQCTN